jgi:hypothetical protein
MTYKEFQILRGIIPPDETPQEDDEHVKSPRQILVPGDPFYKDRRIEIEYEVMKSGLSDAKTVSKLSDQKLLALYEKVQSPDNKDQ